MGATAATTATKLGSAFVPVNEGGDFVCHILPIFEIVRGAKFLQFTNPTGNCCVWGQVLANPTSNFCVWGKQM